VKDFGAVGNGSHDDTTAIQNAFNAAFGPPGAGGHGFANRALNVPVYFPAGNFKITAPLYLINVVGGLIFGAGQGSTTITYGGTFAGGNTVVPSPGDVFVPIIMMQGFNSGCIRDMALSSPASGGSFLGVGIYMWQPSVGGYSQTQVLFQNMNISADTGVLAGYPSGVECSECQYVSVTFQDCAFSGLTVGASNALNHTILGGGANGCARGYYVQSGNINFICNASLANNTVDILSAGASAGSPMTVVGCRTEESTVFLNISANQVYVTGCEQADFSKNFLTGSGAIAVLDGCSGASSNPSFPCTITGTGTLYMRGCTGLVLSSFTGVVGENDVGATTVALLPTPSAAYKGVRMSVTDNTAAAVGNFGVVAANLGSGSNTVPVFCNGSNWLIG
jgi:hypothetical protein